MNLGYEMLDLERQIVGLRARLREMEETNDALQRENDRLRSAAKLVEMETERHRLAVRRLGKL